MFFSIFVPGFGSVFVDAGSPALANAAVRQYLSRNRVRLEEGAEIGVAVPVSVGQIGNNLLLNTGGVPVLPPVQTPQVTPVTAPVTVPEPVVDDAEPQDSEPGMPASPGPGTGAGDGPATGDSTGSEPSSPAQPPAQPVIERLFRFDVPVIGDLYVLATTIGDAVSAGQAHVELFRESSGLPAGFRLGLPETFAVGDLPAGADPNFVIDSTGLIRDDLMTGASSAPDQGEPPTVPVSAQSGQAFFVGKVIGANGVPGFFRLDARDTRDTSEARAILESRFGPAFRVEIVSSPEFLFDTDTDFVASLQRSQLGDVDAFVRTLALVTAPEATETAGENSGGPLFGDGSLPVDVQQFPFASFQNAVAALGLDPEGALGSTISRQFDTLAPVAQIGSLTGTVGPIGQSPGALEGFFRDQFGNIGIAAQTFRDLLAGQTSGDLSADQLLAFQALANPDVSTSRGRGAAGDVFGLARAAAEDRFGSFVASRLLPTNQRLFRELERQLADGLPDTSFLEFARSQNLLPV